MSTHTQLRPLTLLECLDRLAAAGIPYRLDRVRDAVMVQTATPGERWEIEFFDDGHVEVERFVSTGAIGGVEQLDELIATMSGDDDR